MKLAIIAALPRELKYLRESTFQHEIVLAVSGMGMRAARKSLLSLIEKKRPDCVLSIGFAGALFKDAHPGDLIWGRKISLHSDSSVFMRGQIEIKDERNLFNRLSGKISMKEGHVITLASPDWKQEVSDRLPAGLSYPVCEMETYPLANLCLERDIGFFSIRAITDSLEEDISSPFFQLHDEKGRLQILPLAGLIAKNPGSVIEMLRLRKNSDIAARRLCLAVQFLMELI